MTNTTEELLSKIKVLEEENIALSEKVEYSILLNVIAESTDTIEDINVIIDSVLEKICILKQLPFAALFNLKGGEQKLENFYILYDTGFTVEKEHRISEKIIRETRDEGFLFIENQQFDEYGLQLGKGDPHISTLLFYHLSSKFFPDALLLFVDSDPDSQLPTLVYLFEQVITYLVEKLDKLYYWTELQKLNNELEERVAARTEDLQTAKDAAVKADSLKTIFLQNMSHEIRTPLNAIVGFSDLLNKEDMDTERIKEYTGIINSSSSQLLSLVNDILDISKIESGQHEMRFESVDLRKLLGTMNVQFAPIARQKRLGFTYSLPAAKSSLIIKSDFIKLQQVLTNLIGNSIKFTESGEITLSCIQKPGEIIISVSDTGIGIADEHHRIIFDRFRQIDLRSTRSYGGTGLGLYICKTYLDLLGGKIWVESSLGSGSVFHISLPQPTSESKASDKKASSDDGADIASGVHVLIVEDEDTNFMLLRIYLKEMNIRFSRAVNGLEAVEMIRDNQYDVVLMDIQMPVMNGLEATMKIREFNQDIPVIAITAFAFENERKQALDAGCNAHFSKPIKKEVLLKAISDFV